MDVAVTATREKERRDLQVWHSIQTEAPSQASPESGVQEGETSKTITPPYSEPGRMFRVELDLTLYFAPLMNDHGDGVTLTRTLCLPFVPYEGLRLHGGGVEEGLPPEGLEIERVIWDLDRQLFLADVEMHWVDFPVESIPRELECHLEGGWRFGSYDDPYRRRIPGFEGWEQTPANQPELQETPFKGWTEMRMAAAAPGERPAHFDRFLKALIRAMVRARNSRAVAYAIDQTGRFFEKQPDDPQLEEHWRKWEEAYSRFTSMSSEDQYAWAEVTAKYPRLDEIIPIPAGKVDC